MPMHRAFIATLISISSLCCLLPDAAAATVRHSAAKSAAGATAARQWRIDPSRSTLGFATVKNAAVGEGHQFTRLSGAIASSGRVSLNIDLVSVDTGIAIRDQRMRELLFEVAQFPEAQVEAQVSLAAVLKLVPGQSVLMPLDLKLNMHGMATDLGAVVRVQRISSTRVLVATVRPVVVSADALGLTEGLERLRAIAGLQSISPAVPVSLVLEFRLER